MQDKSRKRAALFSNFNQKDETDGPKLELGKFKPKAAPKIDTNVADRITNEEGFTIGHVQRKEQSSEPRKRDGRRLKKSNRTTQFNVRLQPSTAERFWKGAEELGTEYADDFLDHLLKLHEARGQ